jgi:hypothetical protein
MVRVHVCPPFAKATDGKPLNLKATDGKPLNFKLDVVNYQEGKYFDNYILYRGVEQLAARQAHNLEVVGSNPTPATLLRSHKRATECRLFSLHSLIKSLSKINKYVLCIYSIMF